jgi:hypothetical protein
VGWGEVRGLRGGCLVGDWHLRVWPKHLPILQARSREQRGGHNPKIELEIVRCGCVFCEAILGEVSESSNRVSISSLYCFHGIIFRMLKNRRCGYLTAPGTVALTCSWYCKRDRTHWSHIWAIVARCGDPGSSQTAPANQRFSSKFQDKSPLEFIK